MTHTITPTVGRRIHFWPNAYHAEALGVFDSTQPCDAGVLYVWPDGSINIEATGPSGTKLAVQHVRIVPADEDCQGGESHARWMAYQTTKATQESAAEPVAATEGVLAYAGGVLLPMPALNPSGGGVDLRQPSTENGPAA